MLASAGSLPTDATVFRCEPKMDGYRCMAFLPGDGGVRFETRSGRNVTASVPELAGLAAALGTDAVLDGELVVLGADARPDFYALGPRMACSRPSSVERARRHTPVTFMAFDVLWLDGQQLTEEPYLHRRQVLESLKLLGPAWAMVPSWSGDAADVLAACEAVGLEGVVMKRASAPYTQARSRHWVKLKTSAWLQYHAPRRRPGGWR